MLSKSSIGTLAAVLIFWTSATAAAEKLKIGVVIPLSGALAEYGTALKDEFLLAQKERAELFTNVEFLYEDSRYDNTTAVSIINKFASANNINLVYLWGYGPSQAAAPVAEARKIAVMVVSGEQGLNVGRPYVTRFSFRIEQMSSALLGFFRSRGWKRIGLIKVELAYMNGVVDGIRANLKADETLEVVEAYQATETDFRLGIQKLKAKKFDAVGVFLLSGQVSSFYKQANELRFKANTFGLSPFDNRAEIQLAGGLMDGAAFPGIDVRDEFRDRYTKEFGNDVQLGWAANAYDFAILTGMVASRLGEHQLRGLELLAEYRKITSYEGEEREIRYREDAQRGSGFEFQIVMKQVDGESISVIHESRQ